MTIPFCIRNVATHEATLLDGDTTDIHILPPTRVTTISKGYGWDSKLPDRLEVINIRVSSKGDVPLVVRMMGPCTVTVEEAPQ